MTGIERKTMNATPEEKRETLHTPGIPMKAAVYLRVATESQLSVQRETLHRLYVDKLRQEKNWLLTDVFVDIGIRRRNLLKWGQLRRLIQLCEAGEIDIIWTRSTSCFSRYTEELLDITKKFRELEKEGEEHQIEKVGKELRSKFTWVDDSNKIINRAKN